IFIVLVVSVPLGYKMFENVRNNYYAEKYYFYKVSEDQNIHLKPVNISDMQIEQWNRIVNDSEGWKSGGDKLSSSLSVFDYISFQQGKAPYTIVQIFLLSKVYGGNDYVYIVRADGKYYELKKSEY
ncbi:MAG: hypothetical protein ACRC5C_04530, partial [Bacilli bacterium]